MAAKRQAIEEADHAAVEIADQTIRQIDADLANIDEIESSIDASSEEKKTTGTAPPTPQIDQHTRAWLAENTWYNTDAVLRAIMLDAHNTLIGERPGVPQHEHGAGGGEGARGQQRPGGGQGQGRAQQCAAADPDAGAAGCGGIGHGRWSRNLRRQVAQRGAKRVSTLRGRRCRHQGI